MNSEFIVAVHSLVYLAHCPDYMANSETIATNVNTHSARIRKVMSRLRRAGYVRAKEGTGGGFVLDCTPEEIRLSDIYRIVSMGSIKPTWCSGGQEEDCIISCNMENVMNDVFIEAEMSIVRTLAKVTVAEMLERVKQEQPHDMSLN